MVSKEIIEEAAKRGIVPGAVIRCLANSDDISTVPETSEWLIDNGDLYFETRGPIIVIRYGHGPFATVITPAPSSETLEPGMATKCGPAMRAAIMERAKELGIAYGNTAAEDDSYVGVWAVTESCVSPKDVGKVYCYSGGFDVVDAIPTHEFLRLMENTKPPKKELTTEERLAEAVKVIEDLEGNCYSISHEGKEARIAARAFLKSIEP